ncbi:hypothetical protein [Streptococcus massiliensis]|uniref:Phosphoribosylaminoimidazole carboxylase ATPase subunit n=1 Tax=Streptococcus massiliensis TaxID=313439 RepID=A0A380L392_9STRE|nr:hypothetical protein [Streptococcus massiliensis]SUN77000.1 phosphoribosylaminoimidazole carboxylase ATPase subunit [Streptococcus massiliensis]
MIKLITHAFADGEEPIFQIAYASADEAKVEAKLAELKEQFPQDYLAIYKLPLDSDLDQHFALRLDLVSNLIKEQEQAKKQ